MSKSIGFTRPTPSAFDPTKTVDAHDAIEVSIVPGCYAPIWIQQGRTELEIDVREAGDLIALLGQAIKRIRDGAE
jgi:hypothetical protein